MGRVPFVTFSPVVRVDHNQQPMDMVGALRTQAMSRRRRFFARNRRPGAGRARGPLSAIRVAAVAVIAAAGLALVPTFATAATYTVDNSDGGPQNGDCTAAPADCNLAAAISRSNSNGGPDTIDFDPSLQGEIDLGAALPAVSDGVTIAGPGAGVLAVDGQNSHRLIRLGTGGEQVQISDLTFRRGRSVGGGAIYAEVTPLRIDGMRIEDSESVSGSTPARCGAAGTGGVGGAIFARNSAVEINDSVIADSKGSGRGGAICLQVGSPLNVTGSEILSSASTNDGGAIAAFGDSPVTIERSTLSGNRTGADEADGGAVYADSSDVEIAESTLSGNLALGRDSSGGAVYATGTSRISVYSSTFAGNRAPDYDFSGSGGAIAAFGGEPLTVEGSSFSDNEAGQGGGGAIRTRVDLDVENSTFFDNSSLSGSAIYSTGGQIDAESITATANDNADAAISLDGAGGSIRNSIVTGNRREAPDFLGSDLRGDSPQPLALSHTQFGSAFSYLNAGGNILDPDPVLGPLADNGGPTETMAISTASPAYNAGSTTEQGDQRGVPRPQNGSDDIGAYELDDTAPGVSITRLGTTSDRTPRLGFSSPEPDVTGFECALDGPTRAPPDPSYEDCSSPITLGPLADGDYALRVRATDIAGNAGTASEAFTVDGSLRGSVRAPKRQRQKRKGVVIEVRVKANEDLRARAAGRVRVRQKDYRLKSRTAGVGDGSKKTLRLKPKKGRQSKRIAKALKRGIRAKASIKVKLTDRAGNSKTRKFRVRLKR